MTQKAIQAKLEQMKGKSFEYAKQVHTVKSYKIDEDVFEIRTDKNTFKRKYESADDFFKYWYETKENLAVEKISEGQNDTSAMEVFVEKENSVSDNLVKVLLDSIDRVKKDPGYINQAKAINNNVNSILNIQKLKLDLIKSTRNRKA